MSRITYLRETDEIMGWDQFPVFVDGKRLRTFTVLTGEENVKRFCELAESSAKAFSRLYDECEEKRAWNMANIDKAKDWPCFKAMDKLWKAVQDLANIKDS